MGFQNRVKNRRMVLIRRGLQSFHYRKPLVSPGNMQLSLICHNNVRNLG
jgi:hypothetical protein